MDFIMKEGEPEPDDYKALSAGLLSHHTSQGHPRVTTKFCIFLKDKQGKPQAGIIASILWNGMHIDSLWVDESLRGTGYGSQLIRMAEQEGSKRGCKIAYTDTFSWQAPGFYEKLGYKLYGKLDGLPEGNALYYYRKDLK